MIRINNAAFERLRTRAQALLISDGDAAGPLLIELDQENSRQVVRAVQSRGVSTATGPWLPWSEKYARWREKHGSRIGRLMMVLTGTAYDKLRLPLHPSHVREYQGRLRFAFGAADDVAFWHQYGLGRLPVRSFLDKTASDLAHFRTVFSAWYAKRVDQVLRHT